MHDAANEVGSARRARWARHLAVALLSVTLLCVGGVARISTAGADASTVGPLNDDRANAGMSPLAESSALDGVARRHSEEMAAANRLYHTGDLAAAVTEVVPDWQKAGENVGVGPNVEAIEEAFMQSAHPRKTVLGSFNRVGAAAVTDDSGRVWVTQTFVFVPSSRVRAASLPPAPPRPSPALRPPTPAPA